MQEVEHVGPSDDEVGLKDGGSGSILCAAKLSKDPLDRCHL
jgi:hypothetical protein